MERKFLHDLSTPLAALQLHLELLAEQPEAGDEQDARARMRKCVELVNRVCQMVQERRSQLKTAEGGPGG